MTVIRPNSISGVTSITAHTQSIEFYKSDGTLSGANLDGVNINTAGILTASNFKSGTSNVHSTGYECTNINATGIITATKFVGPFENTGDFTIDDYIVHAGDTNTKFGFATNDQFSVETNGAERLRLNNTGHLCIGEANFTAASDIHIKRANAGGDVSLRIGNNTGTDSGTTASLYFTCSPTQNFNTGYIQALRAGGKLNFGYSTNDPTVTMHVSQGLVGIGSDAPTHNLDVVSSSNTYIKLMKSGSTPVYIGAAGADGIIEQTGDFKVKVGGNERLFLDSTGYLQLKTTSANVNVDDLKTEMFQIGHTTLGTNSSGYTHLYNNAYQVNDNSYHYISQNNLGASRHHMGFGDHTFDTAPSGTRGNDITWTTKMKINHDGITFGHSGNPNVFAEFYMTGQAGDGTDDGADWANNGILQLNNSSGSSAGSEILLLGTHAGGKGQIASGFGFKRNNASDWGTSLTFRTHSAATSNIDELNEVMRIHDTGQVTICSPQQGQTPSSTHRIRVSGGAVAAGGIELLQHSDGSDYGAYHTGIRHYAWNGLGKAYRHSQMVHTRYHGEKVWVKTFANGVSNQMARIHFTSFSTWTNGLIYLHTTYSNGNASGLLTYLFTHNANAGQSYGKDIQEIYSIGSTNSHLSMSSSWSFKSWGNNGGHNGENTHALEIRRDGSNAGNSFKIHLVIFGDNGTQHLESAYLTEGTY